MSNSSSGPMDAACCNDGEDMHRGGVDAALTVFSFLVFGLCSLLFICASIFAFSRRMILAEMEEDDVASQESEEEERRKKRQVYISKGLNVKEWVVPDDTPPVESTGGDQDTLEAPPINSSPASCRMGSDNCESLVTWEQEETADCAICLGPFRPQELVCESNNPSCQHVFHKDCMVDWLMKAHHDDCPMCREVYLLKTV